MNSTLVPGDIPPKIILRIVMIGFHGAGKTSFLLRYFEGHFQDQYYPTIGIDFKIRTEQRDGRECKFQVWDTAGAERFHSISAVYYRNANGMLIFVDLSSQQSIEDQVNHWMTQIEKNASDNICRLLVGTKSDLPQLISDEDLEGYASKYNMAFIKTSSKENINVKEAMEQIMNDVYRQSKDQNFANLSIPQRGPTQPAHKSNSCCK
ncbi:hypothetical protein FGO68_gene172 [Halteria grandinella]|uniref:Uncharacterized protein n=1 Tax=Halteria grandinella TaxID=5974 RepID=A0A8J8NJD5_HALGN|nr:hypothetical protein FGO68_gene172 [Halteria grandinella]